MSEYELAIIADNNRTIDQLRRDLATRDRELAEARDRLDEKRQLVKDATDTIARRNAEHDELSAKLADVTFSAQQNWKLYDQARRELAEAREVAVLREAAIDDGRVKLNQARAALAEKEREHLACIEHMQAEFAETMKQALDDRDTARAELVERRAGWGGLLDMRAAQLAAAQEEAKGLRAALEAIKRHNRYCTVGCHAKLAEDALAARQQQPDGKPETLRDHVARHKEGDEGP